MNNRLRSRRAVALIAAYVVALQALLLPLSVAASAPDFSLCASSVSADLHPGAGHATGCPCAAGCGTQCCAHAMAGPAHTHVAVTTTIVAQLAPPPVIVSAARSYLRSPQLPRAPPAA